MQLREEKEPLNKGHILRAGSLGEIYSGIIKEITTGIPEILTSVFRNTEKI